MMLAMSAPDLTADTLASFIDSGAQKHLTLLLGAGASTSSGLPDWDELATRLLLRSRSVKHRTAAELLVKRQDPLLVAEAARKAPGAIWNRWVTAALYEGVVDLDPSALHNAAAGHLLTSPPEETTLLTLNFDTLLESAIRVDSEQPVQSRTDATRPQGVYVVYHLHGIVEPGCMRDTILTLSDFNELLGDPDSWQQELICEAVSKGALLIAGTSYRDPDVRRWLHVALEGQPADHAALVLLARQGFGLSRTDFDEVKKPLAEQWSSIGLTPVILEDFTDAAQIIRELRYIHDGDYQSPQQRARAIWEVHVQDFDRLQQKYVDQLSIDAEELRDAFDVDDLNITLWLADGQGNLARWAAQDRIYRSANDLRLVDSGHDSRWIAGRALGSESPLFQDLDNAGTQRWSTVLAVPIRVEVFDLPEFATAVISVGLPGRAEDHDDTAALWLDATLSIANAWSKRLSDSLILKKFP